MSPRLNAVAAIGASLVCLGVGLGAFGAHGLEGWIEEAEEAVKQVGWWATASSYQLLHGVALVAVGAALGEGSRVPASVWCLVMGLVVFSGTLYAMALGAPTILGAITPIGGVALMVGWAWLAVSFLRPSEA